MQGWPHIAAGEHTLICAPTGSGKTLTAFLASIDRLTTSPRPEERSHRTRVLYISPLRALAFDIEKNLRAPLKGIELAAERLGEAFVAPEVGMRTGDTAANDRQKLIRRPPGPADHHAGIAVPDVDVVARARPLPASRR